MTDRIEDEAEGLEDEERQARRLFIDPLEELFLLDKCNLSYADPVPSRDPRLDAKWRADIMSELAAEIAWYRKL